MTQTPTRRETTAHPGRRHGAAAEPAGDEPDAEDDGREIDRIAARRVSIGARPRSERRVGRRRAVERIGGRVDVAGRDARRAGSSDARTTPTAMTPSRSAGARPSGSPRAIDDDRGERALGRDDRARRSRPGRSTARRRRAAGRRCSRPAHERAGRGVGRRVGSGAASERERAAPTTSPTTMTQPRTDIEPIIRLDRDEARVAMAHDSGGTEAAEDGHHAASVTSVVAGPRPTTVRASRGALLPSAFAPGARPAPRVPDDHIRTRTRFAHLAKTPRKWTGARTPSGLKRVRQAERRHEVLSPAAAPRRRCREGPRPRPQPVDDASDPAGRPRRGAERARPRGEGRRDPPERRRAPQVAPDPQGQRRARWRRQVSRAGQGARASARPPRPRPPRPASPPARPARPRAPRPPPARPAPR